MITFKPIEENVFAAYEDGEITGKAYFNIEGLFCDIYKIECEKDKLHIFQGLVRSVLNRAAGRGVYIGKLSDKDSFDRADTMNFIFDGKIWSNDIPTLLMGSCGCSENNGYEI